MVDLEVLQYVGGLMDVHPFRFAKTMPKHPHWYTLRKKWENDSEFVNCVNLIRENGYTDYFYKTPFKKLDCNGYQYWTMGAPVPETILINKAKINYNTDYCSFAESYDSIFVDDESKEEDALVMSALGDLTGKRILDIGCGTGLLLDYKKSEILPENYVGIDPSGPMADVFKGKHPEYSRSHIQCKFEDFALGDFDLIVSLYGSPSYINPLYASNIRKMLSPRGGYLLMFFAEDYEPISCVKNGVTSSHYKGNWKSFIAPYQSKNFLISRENV